MKCTCGLEFIEHERRMPCPSCGTELVIGSTARLRAMEKVCKAAAKAVDASHRGLLPTRENLELVRALRDYHAVAAVEASKEG